MFQELWSADTLLAALNLWGTGVALSLLKLYLQSWHLSHMRVQDHVANSVRHTPQPKEHPTRGRCSHLP